MERRTGAWRGPQAKGRGPRARSDEPAAGSGSGGDLPPWSSLGLGPAPSPGFERDWEPAEGDLADTADLPDRPPSRLGRGARILIPVCLGLIFVASAVGLIWFDVIGGSATPTPTRLGAASLGGVAQARSVASPRASPRAGTPAAALPRAQAATGQAAAVPATSNPAPTRVPTPTGAATPEPALLLAIAKAAAGGLTGDALGAQLRAALAEQLPGRRIDVAGEDRSGAASIVVTGNDPAPAFEPRVVAIAPLALVTSPRLSLTGVGSDQASALLNGKITDWRDVGAAATLTVEPLALNGAVPQGMKPVAVYKDYEALVTGFATHPGGLALVPLQAVDFRVNVLAVDGVDPLRGTGNVFGYPFGARLYVGVRADRASALKPALDAALAVIGLPRSASAVARLGFAGDIVPGRNPHPRFGAPNDGTHSFVAVANELAAYDLTVANLDGVLSASAGGDLATPFAAAPSLTDGLKLAGIDAVSLANEHVVASGTRGLTDTLAALRAAGIAPFGAGENQERARAPFLVVVAGMKIALLAFDGVGASADGSSLGGVQGAATADSPGVNPFVVDRLRADVAAAAKEADVVIVCLHAGVEDRETPPASAIAAAHAAIDTGAMLVVGTYPRVVAGLETYKGRPIVYSLGNLVADQMQSVQTRQGAILEITLRGATIVGLRFHGVEIEDFNQPRPMTGAEEAALLDRIWWLSDRLVGKG